MNILIVDDEKVAIEGIISGVRWKEIGIDKIFVAYSSGMAKKTIGSETIDILICDIEMPDENGLELISWIRKKNLKIVVMMLTSHANFSYARQAISLGSTAYLLKPIQYEELEIEIKKAIEVSKQINKDLSLNKNETMIHESISKLTAQFWQEVASEIIPPDVNEIKAEAAKRNINFNANYLYVPIIIKIASFDDVKEIWERMTTFDFAMKNLLLEIFTYTSHPVIINYDWGFFVIISVGNQNTDYIQELKGRCEMLIELCNNNDICKINCFLGNKIKVDEISKSLDLLIELSKHFGIYESKACTLSDKRKVVYLPPDFEAWYSSLENHKVDSVKKEIYSYIERIERNGGMTREVLNNFTEDFLQMIYRYLTSKEIRAHLLFSDEESNKLSEQKFTSILMFRKWINHILLKTCETADTVLIPNSLIERVKDYIMCNITEDLKRNDIADYICVHPDYLSRAFKKMTDMSLTEYIAKERIEMAKKYLDTTTKTVSEIASMVGYSNFSYFTMTFKRLQGVTPNAYRKNSR